MEQRGFGAWRQRRQWVVFMVALVPFWSGASAQIRYSISEELKEGTVVGNIAKDLGIDRSTLKERGFRIVSGSTEPLFQVNQNDGILYVNRKIDREEVCERSNVCLINMKTVLENPLEVHYVAVEVLDVNDHSPSFPEKEKRLEIFESALPGARFQLQPARDPDGGIYSVQQYKLSHNDHFRLEVKDRGKDGKIPILNLQKPLDREALKRHTLLLTAIDGDKPPKSGTIEILVDVLDVNDNMPVFTKESYSVTLNENSPIGTTVIQVNATDLDEGSNGEIMYSFGSNVNSKLRELFEVDAISGEIIVKEWIDFEIDDSYEIDIQASDKGSAPLTADKSVTVKIVDLNDNAPEIEVTSFSNAIPEDSRPGTTVALISVSDKDSVLNGKVLCSISDGVPFTLTLSSQDNMYSVVTKSTLDREKQSEYDLTIVAKDAGQPSLSSVKTISVIISDVNDNSPEFSLSPYTFYVTENNDPGFSVFSVSASDRDINENALISYHIPRYRSGDKRYMLVGPRMSIGSTIVPGSNGNTLVVPEHRRRASGECCGFFFNLKNMEQRGCGAWWERRQRVVFMFALVLFWSGASAQIRYSISEELKEGTVVGNIAKDLGIVLSTLKERGFRITISVIISDVNDNSPEFSLSPYTFYVTENNDPGASVFSVSASDRDIHENALISYHILRDGDANYDGTLCHSIQYRSGDKRYMLVGPRMSIGSTIVPGSNGNTLVLPDHMRRASGEVRRSSI
ncbi:unnamed protein product [Coregonus sp. 'balchen']|nr:unnamed protein product [Coregonus sp. 'balchen']